MAFFACRNIRATDILGVVVFRRVLSVGVIAPIDKTIWRCRLNFDSFRNLSRKKHPVFEKLHNLDSGFLFDILKNLTN